MRALVGDRSAEAAEQMRVLYGGSVKPDNARGDPGASRTSTARSWAAPASIPESLARIVGRRAVVTVRPGRARRRTSGRLVDPRRLGHRRARARATRSSWPTRRSSTSSGPAPAHAADRLRAAPWACPRARWATPRWGTSTSARARSCSRTSRASTTRSRTARFAQNDVLRQACDGRRARAGACTCSGWSRTAACTRACDHLQALHRAGRARGRARHRAARLHRRPRHAARLRRRLRAEAEDWLRAAARPRGHGHRALLRDGPRPALGPHRSSPRTRSCTARPSPAPTAVRRRCAPPTSAARPTSSSSRRWSARRARIRDGDAVIFFNFRPDRARQLTRALGEPDFDEFDRGDAPQVR